METKMIDIQIFKKDMQLSDRQLQCILQTLKKRHNEDRWVKKYKTANGRMKTFLYLEGVEWVKDVYFRRPQIYYLDAEIKFIINHIERLEKELEINHVEITYSKMDINELSMLVNKSRSSIQKGIQKMLNSTQEEKRESEYICYTDRKIIITAKGTKWLIENYYKHFFFECLKKYKINLQNIKKGVI